MVKIFKILQCELVLEELVLDELVPNESKTHYSGTLCDVTLGEFSNEKEKNVSDTQHNKSIVRVIRILVHNTFASHGAAE